MAETTRALDDWQAGSPIVPLRMLTRAAAAKILFGDRDDHLRATIARLDQVLGADGDDPHFQSPLRLPLWVPTAKNERRKRTNAELNALIRQIINDHRAHGRYDVFGCLLQAADSETAAIEEMITLFRAGHRALANTLAWAWCLLAQHPDAANSLQAEVDAELGGRPPTGDDLPDLPYSEMILKETLRLHPPDGLVSRQAKHETRLSNYYVPSGSTIFISPYIIHHSARIFPSPAYFLPERFGEGLAQRSSVYAYMPFGGGTYAEGAHAYVMTLGKLILAQSAQRFRMRLHSRPPASAEPEWSAAPHGWQLEPERLYATA